jgi:hypothetical protein|tara:strand:+ start:755 stop:1489 length:735 start_codon:yes stop_codon:yes gene_type:complete
MEPIDGIEVHIKPEHSRIGINLSGGTDSALVMILTCMQIMKHNMINQKTIVPMTGIEVNRPYNIDAAEKILEIIKRKFPKVQFGEHVSFQYNVPKDVHGEQRGYLKGKAHRESELKLFNSGEIDVVYAGISRNPPWKDLPEDHPIRKKREKNRETDNGYLEKWLYGGMHERHIKLWYHRPLYAHDKRKVCEMYYKLDLMNDIFPLTESCIGQAEATNFFTEPCKKCWWCHEKKWAFGLYDGAVV